MDETERKAAYVFCETVIKGEGTGHKLSVPVSQYHSITVCQIFIKLIFPFSL